MKNVRVRFLLDIQTLGCLLCFTSCDIRLTSLATVSLVPSLQKLVSALKKVKTCNMLVTQGLLIKDTRLNIILCLQETKRKSMRIGVMLQKPMLSVFFYHRCSTVFIIDSQLLTTMVAREWFVPSYSCSAGLAETKWCRITSILGWNALM